MRYRDLRLRREQRGQGQGYLETSRQLEELLDIEALYQAGLVLEDRLPRFLPRPALMPRRTHDGVLAQGKVEYVNLFAGILNYYAAFLFAHPLQFKGSSDDYYSRFKSNADGNRTNFQDFLERGFLELLATRQLAVTASLPLLTAQPRHQAEADALGAKEATLQLFPATQICDYEKDDQGQLLWLIVREEVTRRPDPAAPTYTIHRFWFHTREASYQYDFVVELGKSPSDNDEVEPTVVQHNLGRVPAELWELPHGQWLGGQIKAPCIANLRARTALAYHNYQTAFPVLVAYTKSNDKEAKLGDHAVGMGVDDKLEYLTPPSESRQTLENQTRNTEGKVYRVANLDFLIESEKNHSWRSAEAKSLDTQSGHISLKDLGGHVRNFAERVLRLVSAVRGEPDVDWSVSGFEKLDDWDFDSFSTVLEKLSKVDWSTFGVFGETFFQRTVARIAALALPDLPEDDKAAILKQITGTAIPNPALPTTPGAETEKPSVNQPER